MQETDIFSLYSLRRSLPTLAEVNGVHPDDADALGDWTSAKNSKVRIRYADSDSREERSAVVKLTHMLLVRQMAQSQEALSWDVCRHLLCSLNKAGIISQANQMVASDAVQQETPSRFLGGNARPKRKFDITALAKRMKNAPSELEPRSAMPLVQCPTAPNQGQDAHLLYPWQMQGPADAG